MTLASAFPSSDSSIKLAVCTTICLIAHLPLCSGVFLSQSFESCGIFLHDFQPYTREQGDFIHEALEHLHLNQSRPTSLIIKTELSQKEIHPNIFRSMNYDCFFYVHINFGANIFSTIPPFKTDLEGSLYMKALFIILFKGNAEEMLTSDSSKLQLNRQYTIFVISVKRISRYVRHNKKPFVFYATFFFCSFCKHGLLQLNSESNKSILCLKMSSFQNYWAPSLAQHYFRVYYDDDLENEEFCRQQNLLDGYRSKFKCKFYSFILAELIVFASGSNFSVKMYVSNSRYQMEYNKIPQMFHYNHYAELGNYRFWSPIFRIYRYPSIIYCFNVGRVTVAETNMWTKYVPMDIWGLVTLCLLLSSMVYTTTDSSTESVKCIVQNVAMFVNSFLKLIGITLRQSWSHKWILLGFLELMLVALLSLYENSITVNVVVPVVPEPFLKTIELYNNNYTFVVQVLSFREVRENFSDEYNPKNSCRLTDEYDANNHCRVLYINQFTYIHQWLTKYFLEPENNAKYAIVGLFNKHFHLKVVNLVTEKNLTCYEMYTTEHQMYPKAFFFEFTSAIWCSMYKGLSRLQAAGFIRLMEAAQDFRSDLKAFHWTRPLVAKYDRGVNYENLKNNRLQENMITLGNIKPVLCLGLIIIASSSIAFATEVFISLIVPMMRLLQDHARNELEKLFYHLVIKKTEVKAVDYN